MDLDQELAHLGGVATRGRLIRATSRAQVDRALREGSIVVLSHGRYALPGIDPAVAAAHRVNGVLCRESAALYHGWKVKTEPERPQVLVPRRRQVPTPLVGSVELHRGDLPPEDIAGIATSKALTLDQCLRTLPADAALAVADSALRAGELPSLLARVAAGARGPGSRQLREVVAAADGAAANPFESVLRWIALQVPGLHVRPQVRIRGSEGNVRPDLVDEDLLVVIEADSFEWHGSRAALRADARRYNLLVADGWVVLRFSWEDVMFDPDYVLRVLTRVVERVNARSQLAATQPWPARRGEHAA